MSYILDALKKSDQERKQGDVPNLQTVHLAVLPEQKSQWPMYTLILFLLMSLAFVIGILISEKNELSLMPENTNEQLPAATVQIEEKVVEEKKLVSAEPEAISKQEQAIISTLSTREEPSKPIRDSEVDEIAHLHELHDYQQQLIPEMSFAGHVYSSVASSRSVIINGRVMSEGESLMEGMTVEKITSNGVVFRFNELLFRVDVLQDWSFE